MKQVLSEETPAAESTSPARDAKQKKERKPRENNNKEKKVYRVKDSKEETRPTDSKHAATVSETVVVSHEPAAVPTEVVKEVVVEQRVKTKSSEGKKPAEPVAETSKKEYRPKAKKEEENAQHVPVVQAPTAVNVPPQSVP